MARRSPSTCPASAARRGRSPASSTTRCLRPAVRERVRRARSRRLQPRRPRLGVVGLVAAQRRPRPVRRLVVINAVPLAAGYRWHWVARYCWRRRGLGELVQRRHHPRRLTDLLLRQATRAARPAAGRVRRPGLGDWPAGTGRRRSWRSTAPPTPASWPPPASGLGRIDCPALVALGRRRSLPRRRRRPLVRAPAPERAGWSSSTMRATGRGSTAPSSIDRVADFLAADARTPRRSRRLASYNRTPSCRDRSPPSGAVCRGDGPTPCCSSASSSSPTRAISWCAGSPTAGSDAAFANAERIVDLERSLGTLLRARLPAGPDRPHLADRLRELSCT